MKQLKSIIPILIGIILIVNLGSFKLSEDTTGYTLKVEVKELRNSKGVVQFALYNKDESIPDENYKKYYLKLTSKIIENSASVTFDNLPEGKYAINILHDENVNGKIDKGLILPKEGLGFSNFQSIGLSRRPNFEKASFYLSKNMLVVVKVIYL
ncbi:MAG: DUF2141 domain-containing protein [Bacteroidales bacterium]|nr:DUF2141 domain-containing protein [Bacteroidales bacterium]